MRYILFILIALVTIQCKDNNDTKIKRELKTFSQRAGKIYTSEKSVDSKEWKNLQADIKTWFDEHGIRDTNMVVEQDQSNEPAPGCKGFSVMTDSEGRKMHCTLESAEIDTNNKLVCRYRCYPVYPSWWDGEDEE